MLFLIKHLNYGMDVTILIYSFEANFTVVLEKLVT